MKDKFLKISVFVLVFITVFSISFSCFAVGGASWTPPPPPDGSYIGGNVENSNNTESTDDKVYNSDGTLHWDIWDSFRNECVFSFLDNDPDNDYTEFTHDNLVSRVDYGIVTIANDNDSPFVAINNNWDSIRTVALSTPLNMLKNNFYVYENYVGSEMHFKVNVTLNIVNSDEYGGEFRFQDETTIIPRFRIYEGSSNLDYKVNYCITERKYIRSMNEEILSYDFYVSCKFTEPTFVCGFWCGLTFNDPLLITDNSKVPRIIITYSLSPMYFLGNSTFEEYYETEEEVFDKLFKFVLPGVWFNDNIPSYDDTLDLGQLRQALFFIANMLNYWTSNFIIFKVLFNLSICLMLVCVILGISPSFIGIFNNSIKTKSSKTKTTTKTTKSKSNNKKGGKA